MDPAAPAPDDRDETAGERPRMVDGLELHEADDGLVVYDEATDRVHHLNPTAAVILLSCDGEHDAAAIAAVVADTFATAAVPLTETVACLDQLAAEHLVR